MIDLIEVKKSYWKDAALAGGVIGLVVFVITILKVNLQVGGIATILSLAEFLIFAWLIYYYARKRGVKYGSEGFTYGQSMGYILAMMIFAGFVIGLGQFLLSRFIAPAYYEEAYRAMLDASPFYDPDTEMGQNFEQAVIMMRTSPVVNVLGGIFTYLIYGGIIGLVASAFVKRNPDIFADNNPQADI